MNDAKEWNERIEIGKKEPNRKHHLSIDSECRPNETQNRTQQNRCKQNIEERKKRKKKKEMSMRNAPGGNKNTLPVNSIVVGYAMHSNTVARDRRHFCQLFDVWQSA